MSTLPLVSKFLDPEKIKQIVFELAGSVNESPESIPGLCDLLPSVDAHTVDEVVNIVSPFIDKVISNDEVDEIQLDNVSQLAKNIPQLYTLVLDKIHGKLNGYVVFAVNKFVPETRQMISEIDVKPEEFEVEYIVHLLKLLEHVFSKISHASDFSLDKILCFLLTINAEEIYSQALKTLRWRVSDTTAKTQNSYFVWKLIFALINTDNKHNKTNAYILWLRYLNNDNSNFAADTLFQNEILPKSNYFNYLQQGFISELHEHRKLCLSIMKLTILQISADINHPVFEFVTEKRDQYMKEWERFFTVFEIVAIDTSLHQTEAALSDIILLISPKSLIHLSWGFRLLSTGFRAGTESVRKYTLNLLYSIPSENLFLVKHALPILESIFLPYMMLANHLVVIEDKCSYGDILSNYITDMLKSCKTVEEVESVVKSIFTVLASAKDAFDPSKIYVMLGVYHGIKGSQVLRFSEVGSLLNSLFEIQSEGFLYHRMLQTLTLKVLLCFKFESEPFLSALDKFITFNGSELINENIQEVKSFIKDLNERTYDDDSINAIQTYFRWLKNGRYDTVSSSVLAELIGGGLDLSSIDSTDFQSFVQENLEQFVSQPQNPDMYEVLSKRENIKNTIDLLPLWNSIKIDVLLTEEQVLRTLVFKFKFLNALINEQNLQIFSSQELLDFKNTIFVNLKMANVKSKDFYKVKEAMMGQTYKTLDYLMQNNRIKVSEVDSILGIISPNLSNYQSNVCISSLLSQILTRDVLAHQVGSILEILLEIWDNLVSTRLQLNQKDLHKSMIQTIMHPKILSLAGLSGKLADDLISFCGSVIENSVGRRGLLPTLTKSISHFQIHYEDEFAESFWLHRILVDGLTMYQLRSNAFKLEPIIGEIYDETFGGHDSNLYLKVYNVYEAASEVTLMAILGSIKSSGFATGLLNFIIDHQKEYNLFAVIKATDGYEQWIRIKLFTIITTIIRIIPDEAITDHLETFVGLLATDPSPLVRIYIEWIIALRIDCLPGKDEGLIQGLRDLIDAKEMKPTLICCYQRILVLHINQLPLSKQKQAYEKLLRVVIPCATSNKATVRHFSMSLICTIYPQIRSRNIEISTDLSSIVQNMYDSALTNTTLGAYRNGDALLWDISQDFNLVSLSGVIIMRINDHEIEFLTKEQYLTFLTQEQLSYLSVPVGENYEEMWIQNRKRNLNKTTLTVNKPAILNKNPLQTKSGAWETVMDNELDENRGHEIQRSDLIVVSSLVDKPPNLGGICRLCDVLGAGTLALHDLAVKKHPEFRNVAVTADYWMPMIEVAIDNIVQYLRQKKTEGYTLIGLEQTDNSVELNSDLKFPKKSLILLGKEREGVPGELLAELDFCVEIKQVGVIRSMNIQTATAIIVHAYSSQHC